MKSQATNSKESGIGPHVIAGGLMILLFLLVSVGTVKAECESEESEYQSYRKGYEAAQGEVLSCIEGLKNAGKKGQAKLDRFEKKHARIVSALERLIARGGKRKKARRQKRKLKKLKRRISRAERAQDGILQPYYKELTEKESKRDDWRVALEEAAEALANCTGITVILPEKEKPYTEDESEDTGGGDKGVEEDETALAGEKVITSRVANTAGLSAGSHNQAIKELKNKGYTFELIEAGPIAWTIRVTEGDRFLIDYRADGESTSPFTEGLYGELVRDVTRAKVERDTGREKNPILIPDTTSISSPAILGPEVADYYNTFAGEVGAGTLFQYEMLNNSRVIIGRGTDGQQLIAAVSMRAGIFKRTDGSITLFHVSKEPSETTFKKGTAIHSYVTARLGKDPRVQYEGRDEPGSPYQVLLTYPGGDVEVLFPRARFVTSYPEGSAKFINNNGTPRLDVGKLRSEERRAVVFNVFRNLNFSITGEASNFAITAQAGGALFEIERVGSGETQYNYTVLTLPKDGAVGSYSIRYEQNPYLYLMGSMVAEITANTPGAIVRAGGDVAKLGAGYVVVVEDGQTYVWYGSGATYEPGGVLNITTTSGGTYGVKENAFYYDSLLEALNDGFTASIDSLSESEAVIAFSHPDYRDIYVFTFYVDGTDPAVRTVTPASTQLFSLLQTTLLSNILNMQFQTSQNIINNIFPTPVDYYYY